MQGRGRIGTEVGSFPSFRAAHLLSAAEVVDLAIILRCAAFTLSPIVTRLILPKHAHETQQQDDNHPSLNLFVV
jgi:hypothetical protein